MFDNRESFMYDLLLPFIHPTLFQNNSHEMIMKDEKMMSDDDREVSKLIVNRKSEHASKQTIQNQKKNKHISSLLSKETIEELLYFYENINVEMLLFNLQETNVAKVVPSLNSPQDRWWSNFL